MTTGPTPAQAEVLRTLQRYPNGIRMADLALTLDLTAHATTMALRALRALGLAAPDMDGSSAVVWATTEDAERLRAAADQRKEQAAAARLRARDARKRSAAARAQREQEEAARKAAEMAEIDGFARPPMRVLRAVGEWKPEPRAGAASVFEWRKYL